MAGVCRDHAYIWTLGYIYYTQLIRQYPTSPPVRVSVLNSSQWPGTEEGRTHHRTAELAASDTGRERVIADRDFLVHPLICEIVRAGPSEPLTQ